MSTDEPLDGSLFGPGQPCFGCSPDHPHGFRLSFERIEDGVQTRFVPGELQQGPVGIMHGGLVMTLADEVAAWAIIAQKGRFGFTTKASCRFIGPVRMGVELLARGTIVNDRRRMMNTKVEVEQDGKLCFTADLQFAIMDKKGAERLMGIELPKEWERFGRE